MVSEQDLQMVSRHHRNRTRCRTTGSWESKRTKKEYCQDPEQRSRWLKKRQYAKTTNAFWAASGRCLGRFHGLNVSEIARSRPPHAISFRRSGLRKYIAATESVLSCSRMRS